MDVAGIVSQLMQAESKPLNKLQEKITVSTTKISQLGMFKAQLSTFQTALNDLQTPSNFSAWAAKLSQPNFATADLTSSAVAGSYQLDITQLALPSIWNVPGFASKDAALEWYAGQSAIKPAASATVFYSGTNYVLSLKANTTGTAAGFSISGASPTGLPVTEYQTAQDAQFKLNGVSFTRASNTVSDALAGVTLNLAARTDINSPVTLSISQAESSAKAKMESLAKSYNDLQTLYKQQTQASIDSSTRGVLNSDFALSSLMRQIFTGLMKPLTGTAGSDLTGTGPTDLTALGLKLSDTGMLSVDNNLLKTATTLQSRLASGLKIGFDADQGNDLSTRITQMLTAGGVLQERIATEQKVQSDLNTRKTNLQDKLLAVEARYTAQYSALDALLFKLNSTSDSLKSALDGLTASQQN